LAQDKHGATSERSRARPRAPAAELAELARAITDARRTLAAARRALAQASVPRGPACVTDGRYRWAQALLARHAARLAATPAVAGYGLAVRAGRPIAQIYVREPLRGPQLAALSAPLRGGARALEVEVVRFGPRVARQLGGSASIGTARRRTKGTLGAFAYTADGRPCAITAMHVVAPGARGDLAASATSDPVLTPSPRDGSAQRAIGRAARGTLRGVDAARIDLAPGVVPNWTLPSIGPILGWRPTTFPGDHLATVRAYGAQSGLLVGRIMNPMITLPAYDLVHAIVVEIDTAPGDSGCAIVDSQNLVLGFLVGHGRDQPASQRLFCAAGPVLEYLECDIPSPGPRGASARAHPTARAGGALAPPGAHPPRRQPR
jgi:hypothetical protein